MSHGEGQRVRQAREIARLTQTDLARAADVSQPTVARIENGLKDPDDRELRAIAEATRMPVGFFTERGPVVESVGTTLRFREHSRLVARDRIRAQQLGMLAVELLDALADDAPGVTLPRVRLPRIEGGAPQDAARLVRRELGMDQHGPVGHLARSLERVGVRVFQLPEDGDGAENRVQAFSEWTGELANTPLLFAFRQPGDRLRMSMAHELGHLTMHGYVADDSRAEAEAFAFASEFLMPAESFAQDVDGHVTLTKLAELKGRWRVSMAAMIRRCETLGLIDESRTKSLWVQIARRGWRKREPVHVEPERPRLLRQLAEMTYGDPPSPTKIAAAHRISPELVAQLINEQQPPTTVDDRQPAKVLDLTRRRNDREAASC